MEIKKNSRGVKWFFLLAIMLVSIISPVSAATYHGSFNVDVGSGSIIIGNTCEENWSGFWSECQNSIQTFVCFESNQCGTETLKPSQCGEIRTCSNTTIPPINNGDGGSGGGGGGGSGGGSGSGITILSTGNGNNETCAEKWICNEWSNKEQECGERTCQDINNCGTEELKPKVDLKCEGEFSSGITGAVIDGVTGFAKSKIGASILIIIIIAGAFILISKQKSKVMKGNNFPTP